MGNIAEYLTYHAKQIAKENGEECPFWEDEDCFVFCFPCEITPHIKITILDPGKQDGFGITLNLERKDEVDQS